MLAAAYMVADGSPITLSPELLLLREIDRYGVSAVMGRSLSHNEILRLRAAESVISAYNEKYAQEDWAKWAQDNPEKDKILAKAMRLAGEYGAG